MKSNTGIFKMKRPLIASQLLFISTVGITVAASGHNPASQTKGIKQVPNIVLILADDLGYGDLSCYGATKISTPAIDRLATEGMKFTNAYTSSSLCSPSRYSLLTGRYAWRTRLEYGVLTCFDKPLIEKERPTIASMLKQNGYHNVCIGKWHLGFEWGVNEKAPANPDSTVFGSWSPKAQDYIDFSKPAKEGPLERGFDYFFGMAGSNNMQPFAYMENDRVTQAPSEVQIPYDHGVSGIKAPNWDIKTVNQIVTFKAVDVIHDHFKNFKEQPLFLYFPTISIHRPCLPTFTKGKSQAGLRGDIVVELDWTVNEIIRALKENNAYENTLIVFTSDNGPMPGDPVLWLDKYKKGNYEDYHQPYADEYSPELANENGNEIWKRGWITYGHKSSGESLGFKSDSWEGGFKVPFIVRWPNKIEAGAVNKNMICLSDVFATFADLFGESQEQGEDSYSFLSNLMDVGAPQVRKSLTIAGGASGAFVEINNGWKYIEAARPKRWPETFYPQGPSIFEPQLYNLKEDKLEQNNLYGKMPGKVSELKGVIEKVKTHPKSEAIR